MLPILVISKILDTVMSLAQEAETGAGFFNGNNLSQAFEISKN